MAAAPQNASGVDTKTAPGASAAVPSSSAAGGVDVDRAREAAAKIATVQQSWGPLNPMLLEAGERGSAGSDDDEEYLAVAAKQQAAELDDLDLLATSANMGFTSDSHPLDIAWLRHTALPLGGGRIGIVECPGRIEPFGTLGRSWNRSLATDMEALQRAGTHVLVSLVQSPEAAYMHVDSEKVQACALRYGMTVLGYPTNDFYLPADATKCVEFVAGLLTRTARKQNVVLYDVDGKTRTGLFAAVAMLLSGLSLTDALDAVRSARRGTANKNQTEWLQNTLVPFIAKRNKTTAAAATATATAAAVPASAAAAAPSAAAPATNATASAAAASGTPPAAASEAAAPAGAKASASKSVFAQFIDSATDK